MRHLTASPGQTALLTLGVAAGVFIFVFMSALIGGLADLLVARTIGNIAHVSVEPAERQPDALAPGTPGLLLAQQRAALRREQMRTAAAFEPLIAGLPGVVAISPQITGNAFAVVGQATAPVGVTGVEPDRVNAIAEIGARLVAGSTALTGGSVLIGSRLAADLGLRPGQALRLRTDAGAERVVQVGGVFEIGVDALDRRSVFVSLSMARTLFAQTQGVSRIEVKLADPDDAPALAAEIAARTGLRATPWTEGNAQLLEGLRAQANTGTVIKGFALVTIVIGVASALMLSTYRRRPEIGIMRTMGASRRFVVAVFVAQGALIGLAGALVGAGAGYLALSTFPPPGAVSAGGLPIDVGQGGYGAAIALTVVASVLAAILPARAAARTDPAEAIGS